jgi:hypothetical protein
VFREDMEKSSNVLLVDELGRSVALGERNYLRDVWTKTEPLNKYPMPRFNSEDFQQILRELSFGMNPSVLLVPIEKYVEMASWTRSNLGPMIWDSKGPLSVLSDGRNLRIIWSNMYAPLDKFILVDQSAIRWIVKPDLSTQLRLTALFVENAKDPNKIDFYIKTVARAELSNMSRVKLLRFE